MVEKFADYEGGFLDKAGEFEFEITDYELKDGPKGPCAVLGAKSVAGITTLYHSLNPKARWSYNKLIKACLKLETAKQIQDFECDYATIGQELIGKKFIGKVECQQYEKEIKIPNDDGTFTTDVELKDSFKVVEYKIAVGGK